MKYVRSCANCINSRAIALTTDVLCRKKGVVSSNFVCIYHKFIPNFKSFKDLDYKCIDCANFIVHEKNLQNNQSIGLCRLFSVRCYDGNKKNVCSKFVMTHRLKASILNNVN